MAMTYGRRQERLGPLGQCDPGWDDPSWGDWRSKCFHLLGIDVMLDERGRAHLLEVNCNPAWACAVYTGTGAAGRRRLRQWPTWLLRRCR